MCLYLNVNNIQKIGMQTLTATERARLYIIVAIFSNI